jgi:hypothetical protein
LNAGGLSMGEAPPTVILGVSVHDTFSSSLLCTLLLHSNDNATKVAKGGIKSLLHSAGFSVLRMGSKPTCIKCLEDHDSTICKNKTKRKHPANTRKDSKKAKAKPSYTKAPRPQHPMESAIEIGTKLFPRKSAKANAVIIKDVDDDFFKLQGTTIPDGIKDVLHLNKEARLGKGGVNNWMDTFEFALDADAASIKKNLCDLIKDNHLAEDLYQNYPASRYLYSENVSQELLSSRVMDLKIQDTALLSLGINKTIFVAELQLFYMDRSDKVTLRVFCPVQASSDECLIVLVKILRKDNVQAWHSCDLIVNKDSKVWKQDSNTIKELKATLHL